MFWLVTWLQDVLDFWRNCLEKCWNFICEFCYSPWVNILWPSDTIWQQEFGSTLVHVMACCLTAPSHYLSQCWLIISKVQWHSCEGNFARDTSASNHLSQLNYDLPKISFKSPRGQWVNGANLDHIENNVCTRVANCLCAHERVILVFISRGAQQREK